MFGAIRLLRWCSGVGFVSQRLVVRRWCGASSPLFRQIKVDNPVEVLGEDTAESISELVNARALERWNGNYESADQIRQNLLSIRVPQGYEICIEDIPRKQGGGSQWNLLHENSTMPGSTVLQLAHMALGLAVATSTNANLARAKALTRGEEEPYSYSRFEIEKNEQLHEIVQQVLERLELPSVQFELDGRKAADAAFWFALAGVEDEALFERLLHFGSLELERFGNRPSFQPKYIYQTMDRFAAAGVTGLESKLLKATARELHSDRSLLLLWKFSTKQKKQRAFLQSALKHWERQRTSDQDIGDEKKSDDLLSDNQAAPESWMSRYEDPSRPLVVDIGCGMGVSVLGLSTCDDAASAETFLSNSQQWKDCNYVGVDLGGLGIDYAQSIATRWGIDGRTSFVVAAAEDFVERLLSSYLGPIQLCLLQFPTPYRLRDSSGNDQLPTNPRDGFMVTPKLLEKIGDRLIDGGKVLLQSNCEDVAVYMRSIATLRGTLEVVENVPSTDYGYPTTAGTRIPHRTLDWIAMNGERAEGMGWYQTPLLPRKGATETEVACILNGTPVHRCLLTKKSID